MKERSLADIDLLIGSAFRSLKASSSFFLIARSPGLRIAQLVEDVPAGSSARKSCSFAAPLGPVGGLSPGGGTRDFWAVDELVTVNFSSAGLYPFALYCAQEIGICR
jgi:hypothetical protein